MLHSFLALGRSFLHLIYPPLCIHCEELLSDQFSTLCTSCLAHLELINAKERCPLCFSSEIENFSSLCTLCCQQPPLLNGTAAAFDYSGPAATLVKLLKYEQKPYLAEGCAAYLATQFLQLEWPMPDFLVPVPIPWIRYLERGYNQSFLLAEALGKLLNRPTLNALKRKSGDYSQASLSRQQRTELNSSSILLHSDSIPHIMDKSILLIDDVLTTGSTLQRCSQALLAGCPKSLYALTVCYA